MNPEIFLNQFKIIHMRNYCIALLFILSTNAFAQSGDNAIGKFALSVEPLGFVQFGPMVNAEIGLTDNLALNAHVRFGTAGLLLKVMYLTNDDEMPDKMNNIAYGGGLKYLFGDRKNKPYLGLLCEFGKRSTVEDQGEQWEHKANLNHFDFIINGGYRIRSASGFYLTTGAYLGAEFISNDTWYYTESDYSNEDPFDNENSVYPFFMIEIGIGIEF